MRIFNYPLVGFCMLAMLGSANAQELSYKDTPPSGGLLLTGSLGLWGGFAGFSQGDDVDGDEDFIDDTGRVGLDARFNIPVNSSVSIQLDVDVEFDTNKQDDGGIEDYENMWQTGLHLSRRLPGSHLIGVFGGIGAVIVNSDDPEVGYLVGVEGQYSFANTTLYGQVGFFDVPNPNDNETLTDSWFLRGEGRHFFSSNMMFSSSLIYGQGQDTETNTGDIDYLGWELKYQQKRDDSPFSWNVGYDGHYMRLMDEDGTETVTEHVIKVGINFSLGDSSESLRDNNDRGATLSIPTEPLRAAGYTIDIID